MTNTLARGCSHTQALTYAWRPRCLFHVPEYVFDQWLYKEAIPKSALVKRLGKRKPDADADGEENDEDEQSNTRSGEGQMEDALVDTQVNPTTDPELTDANNDRLESREPPRRLPHQKCMISREDIRALMSPDGRATHIGFQPGHPQYLTHRLALNLTQHIPVLNGARTKGVETVRQLVASANTADLEGTIIHQGHEEDQSVPPVRPGDALRARADEYALQLLAVHKPWDGTGQNILDVEVAFERVPPPENTDDTTMQDTNEATTHTIRMTSYSECLLKWFDAEASTAIPLYTKRILEHHQDFFDLKKIASNMSHARIKQQRQALGLPPTNNTQRCIHADENNDDDEDSGDENDNDMEGAGMGDNPIHEEPRTFDRSTRAMLNAMHIGTYDDVLVLIVSSYVYSYYSYAYCLYCSYCWYSHTCDCLYLGFAYRRLRFQAAHRSRH